MEKVRIIKCDREDCNFRNSNTKSCNFKSCINTKYMYKILDEKTGDTMLVHLGVTGKKK